MPGTKVWRVWKWARVLMRRVWAIEAGVRLLGPRRGLPWTMPALFMRIVGVPS